MAFKPLTVNTPVGEKAHILAEDDAALYDGIFGEDCVLKLGEQFASKTISNNVIRIMDGVVVVGGHVGRIIKGDYEDMMIDNGTADQKRNDLIVARFQSGGTGGTDTYSLVVVKGTPGTAAKDPTIVQEDLYAGGKQRDYPLYRVRIENLSVVGVDQLFKVNRNFRVLAEELDKNSERIESVKKILEERTNGKVKIYPSAEGGNIGITSPNNIYWEIDAVQDNLRIYTFWNDKNFTNYVFRGTGVDGGGAVALTKEVEKKMDKMTVVNNATTTVAGTLLDGRMGKILHDDIANTQNYTPAVAKNNIISNVLLVDTKGTFNAPYMYSGVIATEDASKISGCPVTSGAFYAYREVFFLPNQGAVGNTQGKTIVRLTESYPISGRVWITSYNTDIQNWSPWQEHAPFYANEAGIGSAYGVNASYKSSGRITTVYFNGQHVGDSMPAYSQRNMGTLPSGKRPSSKVQSPVTGVNGLYLTVEPSGVVSMRNEHYAQISFAAVTVSGAVTFVN